MQKLMPKFIPAPKVASVRPPESRGKPQTLKAGARIASERGRNRPLLSAGAKAQTPLLVRGKRARAPWLSAGARNASLGTFASSVMSSSLPLPGATMISACLINAELGSKSEAQKNFLRLSKQRSVGFSWVGFLYQVCQVPIRLVRLHRAYLILLFCYLIGRPPSRVGKPTRRGLYCRVF